MKTKYATWKIFLFVVMCRQLREHYKSRGHSPHLVDSYTDWIKEMEEKWNKIDFMDDEESVICFNLKIN